MKIYFSGSIRSGRENVPLYQEIINHLKKYGQVLTEHVGDPNLTVDGEQGLVDEQIYKRDMAWLGEADIVIAEVSTPSLGVGYEIREAERLGKKVICLFKREGKKLSAMISGNQNLKVKVYTEKEEAFNHIDDFFKIMS